MGKQEQFLAGLIGMMALGSFAISPTHPNTQASVEVAAIVVASATPLNSPELPQDAVKDLTY